MRKGNVRLWTMALVTACLSVTTTGWSLDRGQRKDLRSHLEWCLTEHGEGPARQGIMLFQPGTETFREQRDLRREFSICQERNENALYLIKQASPREFERALHVVVSGVEDTVEAHLKWVAYDRGRAYDMQLAAHDMQVSAIRSIYNREQSHSPEARMMLRAVSDGFILETVATL